MNIPSPRVSVIIPVHNCAPFISEAVNSLFDQDYDGGIEIIVIDDGSTDNTREILQKYGDRIIYRHVEHRGVAAARNEGLSLSHGEIISFLDADDVWTPERLRRVVETFDAHPGAGIVFHNFSVIDVGGKSLVADFYGAFCAKNKRRDSLISDIISGSAFCGGSSFSFRGEVLRRCGRIPEDIRRGVDFYQTAVASCCTHAEHIDEILGSYRLHDGNMTFLGISDRSRSPEIHRDFSHTYRKLLLTLADSTPLSRRDLGRLERRYIRSCMLSDVLSGNRAGAVKKLSLLFRVSGIDTLLADVELLLFVLFIPRSLYSRLVRGHFLIKRLLCRA